MRGLNFVRSVSEIFKSVHNGMQNSNCSVVFQYEFLNKAFLLKPDRKDVLRICTTCVLLQIVHFIFSHAGSVAQGIVVTVCWFAGRPLPIQTDLPEKCWMECDVILEKYISIHLMNLHKIWYNHHLFPADECLLSRSPCQSHQ